MRALRTLSKILMIPPLVVFLYDLVKEWFVYNRFKIRSLEQWWTWLGKDSHDSGRPVVENILGAAWTQKLMAWPAPVSLMILPAILYAIYRIWFKIKGGHSTGAYTYRSHD